MIEVFLFFYFLSGAFCAGEYFFKFKKCIPFSKLSTELIMMCLFWPVCVILLKDEN